MDQRQSNAAAFMRAPAGILNAAEAFEEMADLFFGNAGACIADG